MVAENGHSKENGYEDHTRQRKNSKRKQKDPTQCVLDTTIRKQTQITLIRHDPSYRQLEVKTNRTSCVCGNNNTEPKAQRHIIGEHKKLKR